jgi:hypothetical protein
MVNGRSGSYGLFPPVVPVAPGVTTRAFGVGIMYLFDFALALGGPKRPPEAPAPPPAPPEPPPPPPAPATPDKPAATPPTEPPV